MSRAPLDEILDAVAAATTPRIERDVSGNEQTLTSTSPTIRTIVGLLDACGIERESLQRDGKSEWFVERYTANKWDQASAERGVIELWQVKAILVRRRAQPVQFEPLRPIVCTHTISPSTLTRGPDWRDVETCVIIPDSQNGFCRRVDGTLDPLHDPRAWYVAVELVRAAKPDRVVLLGDMLDLPDWSDRFISGPEFAQTTQAAADDLHQWLVRVREAHPTAVVEYIEGNHERRLVRAQQRSLVAACGLRPAGQLDAAPLLSVPRLLALDAIGVQWVGDYPSGEVWLSDALRVSHGHTARSGEGETAKAILQHAAHSEIYGHLHRTEMLTRTVHVRGRQVTRTAFCPGTIARIDGAVPAAVPRVNWQQGCAVVTYEPRGTRYGIEPVPIRDGLGLWRGRVLG